MNVDKEIQSTIRPCLRSAIKRWFDLQGKETPSEKQYNQIIKAFDTAHGILSLIDINIMDNYKSSNELDQIITISKLLCGYIGSYTDTAPDFTGFMVNTLTQDQLTKTLSEMEIKQ